MSDPVYLQGRLGMRVVIVFAAAYFLSYAFRAINAVIAPALTADLQLSNADLGLLSSAYFVGFACLQLPLGVWLDKYGPRRTESALLVFAALGAAIFASSSTLTGLWVGRALIGIGVSACLMAPLKAYRVWYPPERQSQLASWMLVFGTCGALATTVPVAMLLPLIGWRGVFWAMAALIVVAAALVFFRVRPVERSMAQQQSEMSLTPEAPGGYKAIFTDPYFRRMAWLGGVYQGGFMAIQTLWAGPWMVDVLGLSVKEASQVLFLFNLFLMLSYIALSWWAPRHVAYGNRPGLPALRVVTIGLALSMLIQLAMLLFPYRWAWIFWVLFALVVTVTTLAQTHVSLSFASSQAGRANSAFNLTLFIGAFGLQWGMGLLIDIFVSYGWSQSSAMRMAWAVYLLIQLGALVSFIGSRSRVAPFAEKTVAP
jgi:predicted MFS family arabinose efflux permease